MASTESDRLHDLTRESDDVLEQTGGLLTVADTATLLQRSTEQVRRYLREGVLPGRRIGGQWFISRGDAEAFLKRRREGSDFSSRLAASDPDPLGAVIGMAGSGGSNIASGHSAYSRMFLRGHS